MAEKVSRTYRMSPELAEELSGLKGELEGRDLSEFVEAAIWAALSERKRRRVKGGSILVVEPRAGFRSR